MTATPAATLICPKCRGAMTSYERNGVTIDQCQECRGIFLDRGELDRLIDAEEQRYQAGPVDDGRTPGRDERSYQPDHERGHHDESKRDSHSGGKRRRSGFLGELFD